MSHNRGVREKVKKFCWHISNWAQICFEYRVLFYQIRVSTIYFQTRTIKSKISKAHINRRGGGGLGIWAISLFLLNKGKKFEFAYIRIGVLTKYFWIRLLSLISNNFCPFYFRFACMYFENFTRIRIFFMQICKFCLF